jgi:hypothetical protein
VNNKEVHPAIIIASIVIVVIILGIVGWKTMTPKTYSGPPVDMGKVMAGHQSGGAPARNGPAGMPGGQSR